MPIVDAKLLAKARAVPQAVRFEEALRLARQLGFEKVRQVRSHRLFRMPAAVPAPLNLQEGPGGRVKVYQLAVLLRLVPEG